MPATAKTRHRRQARPSWKSRAVVRTIEAGSDAYCEFCGERVKFQAKHKHLQVICNVYVKGVWARVEHYHATCYDMAGQPYGAAAA